MERRGWPWKKKITEKLASAALELKQSNEQLDSRMDLKDRSDSMTPLQQAEARLKILTEELAAKDEVVQQHAKVAEEAVTGWEKAESEAASMRQQLDAETQKRLATEDRVSHLDGALKECMRQLRLVREQQEQKIHETVLKKTREWEIIREEMEARMAKVANELLESEAEKSAMNKSLHERAMLIKEAKEGRSRAEEEVKLLQVRLEMSEKEQAKWKYEVHVLSKELEIRNEELEYNKKASEIANKQHLENVKKVAKLETECQRLRLLVRKKLPGPAAVAQMRMEVEALGMLPSLPVERGRRMSPSPRRNQSAGWKQDRGGTLWSLNNEEAGGDRLLAMEEENRALKEALSKSNNELHAARLLCARTASKLSSVEEQLENSALVVPSLHGLPKSNRSVVDGLAVATHVESSQEPSVASVSEDGAAEDEISCAESWATALMSELAHFGKKEKGSSVSDSMLDSSSCNLMDDFAEMEKLASMAQELPAALTVKDHGPIKDQMADKAGHNQSNVTDFQNDTNRTLQIEGQDLQNLDSMNDLSIKLTHAEKELNATKLQKLALKGILLNIEKHLTIILEAGEAASLSNVLNEVQNMLNEVRESGVKDSSDSVAQSDRLVVEMESAEVRDTRVWSPSGRSSCQSEESATRQESMPASEKVNVGSQLTTAMHKVVSLVEALTQVDYDVRNSEADFAEESGESLVHADDHKQWRNSEFDSCVQSLVALCNGVLQDKVDILDFVAEMTSALDWLVSHIFSLPHKMIESNGTRRRLDWDKCTTNVHGLVSHARKLSSAEKDLTESDSPTIGEYIQISEHQEALSRSLDMHVKKVHSLEEQLTQLKCEKDEANTKLKAVTEELELLKSELLESQCAATQVQHDLTAALESKQSLMSNLTSLAADKTLLESRLSELQHETKKFQEKIQSLEMQLQDETQCRKDIEAMFQDLQEKYSYCTKEQRLSTVRDDPPRSSGSSAGDMVIKLRKEHEIAAAAEKLAECQQTILALGKQLKGLGVPNDGEAALSSSKFSTMNDHRMHSLSDQLPSTISNGGSFYMRGMESPSLSTTGFGQSMAAMDNAERSLEYAVHGGGSTQRGHVGNRHGLSYGQVPSSVETYNRADGMVSPDYQETPRASRSAAKDLAITSPGRSPARFLSLKGRGSEPKPETPSSEKHATGFSRFFSRNKPPRSIRETS